MTAFKVVDASGLVESWAEDGSVTCTVQRPSRVRPGMSCAAADEPVTLHDFGDKALEQFIVDIRRRIEDAERDGRDAPADRHVLTVATALRRVRLRMRFRYGARDAYGPPGDRGTDVYDHWLRLDEPPSYALAFAVDRHRFETDRSHVVAWQHTETDHRVTP